MNSNNNINFLLVLILLLTVITGCTSKPSIEPEVLSLNTSRYGHAAVNDGQKIYVIAGANKSGFLSDIEIIDPSTGETEVLKPVFVF